MIVSRRSRSKGVQSADCGAVSGSVFGAMWRWSPDRAIQGGSPSIVTDYSSQTSKTRKDLTSQVPVLSMKHAYKSWWRRIPTPYHVNDVISI